MEKLINMKQTLHVLTDKELKENGIEIGKACTLKYQSGVQVEGIVVQLIRKDGKLLLISFKDCTVSLKEQTLFEPEWGTYDLAIGESIASVFAGAADSEQFYADLEEVETKPLVKRALSKLEKLYGKVRNIRETTGKNTEAELVDVIDVLTNDFQDDWLLRIEVMELLVKRNLLQDKQVLLKKQLEDIKPLHEEYPVLIERGLLLTNS